MILDYKGKKTKFQLASSTVVRYKNQLTTTESSKIVNGVLHRRTIKGDTLIDEEYYPVESYFTGNSIAYRKCNCEKSSVTFPSSDDRTVQVITHHFECIFGKI